MGSVMGAGRHLVEGLAHVPQPHHQCRRRRRPNRAAQVRLVDVLDADLTPTRQARAPVLEGRPRPSAPTIARVPARWVVFDAFVAFDASVAFDAFVVLVAFGTFVAGGMQNEMFASKAGRLLRRSTPGAPLRTPDTQHG
eukprot:TRINITY_DN3684_c0_g1_i1.p1 TRINITY_DN3684_c0_g1~~TRINITY_DN3684_c0_g1_i1.p1  ORF type:complete len:139 (-),score=3.47 TRINITY_DN3684_c0_g1_i1:236-652(-)